jgi:hypothetical protein
MLNLGALGWWWPRHWNVANRVRQTTSHKNENEWSGCWYNSLVHWTRRFLESLEALIRVAISEILELEFLPNLKFELSGPNWVGWITLCILARCMYVLEEEILSTWMYVSMIYQISVISRNHSVDSLFHIAMYHLWMGSPRQWICNCCEIYYGCLSCVTVNWVLQRSTLICQCEVWVSLWHMPVAILTICFGWLLSGARFTRTSSNSIRVLYAPGKTVQAMQGIAW